MRKQLNLPNILTLIRILLTPVLLFYVVQLFQPTDLLEFDLLSPNAPLLSYFSTPVEMFDYRIIALCILTFCIYTDRLDGKIARSRGIITSFGELMDPIADKLLILSLFAVFCYGGLLYVPLFIIIFVREVSVTIFRFVLIYKKCGVLPADKIGKTKTVLQMIYCYVGILPLTIILYQVTMWAKLPADMDLKLKILGSALFILTMVLVYALPIVIGVISTISGINYFIQGFKIMHENNLSKIAKDVLQTAESKTLAFCESLTGGMLANTIVSIPGASKVFKGSAVTYASEMKTKMLGVSCKTIEKHGVVSAECAQEMAFGGLGLFESDICVATTGVAGPDEQEGKLAGTVFLGIAWKLDAKQIEQIQNSEDIKDTSKIAVEAVELKLTGKRASIRKKTCLEALKLIISKL